MNFLTNPRRFLFFTGKGGVCKTSIACPAALRLAVTERRVLLVSTDPASNVSQVFNMATGNRITPIPAVPGLDAFEIDPQAAAQTYRSRCSGQCAGGCHPPCRASRGGSVVGSGTSRRRASARTGR
jgi:arsenite-transporting ATPase